MPPGPVAATWLAHAAGDLALAETGPHARVPPELFCYHAQQAAEKAIKAVLVARGQPVPFIHDIRALLELAEPGVLIPGEVYAAAALTAFAARTRYPGDPALVTNADLSAAVGHARRVIAWANLWVRP